MVADVTAEDEFSAHVSEARAEVVTELHRRVSLDIRELVDVRTQSCRDEGLEGTLQDVHEHVELAEDGASIGGQSTVEKTQLQGLGGVGNAALEPDPALVRAESAGHQKRVRIATAPS